MQINFLKYNQKISPVKEFGLYDIGNNTPVILDYKNKEKWEATVECNNRSDYNFIAVDNVKELLEYKKQNNNTNTCDAILHTKDTICFIELKNQRQSWFTEVVTQLETTINIFKENHKTDFYSSKRAHAVNKSHPNFRYSWKCELQAFHQRTGFILRTGVEIKELR